MSSSGLDSTAARRIRIAPDFFGFRVEVGRHRVFVELAPWSLRVHGGLAEAAELDLADWRGLYLDILTRVTHGNRLTAQWPPRTMAELSLGRGVERHRLRLIARVPSDVYRVQERVRREGSGGLGDLHLRRQFYERRYLVADVLKFRAAAIAVGCVRDLCNDFQARSYADVALDRLESWPALFSPDGSAYGSLRRTLMNLPYEVPAPLVRALRFVHLPRPVTDPLELTTICAALTEKRMRWHHPDVWPDRIKILLHAKAAEIEDAIARVAEHTGRSLDCRSHTGVVALIRYLDFPDSHAGRLSGLVEKAIRWHGDIARRGLAELLVEVNLPPVLKRIDTPTVPPKFPIPEDSRIRFLATVGSILEEGRNMGHCVATFAATAVRGLAHFFHVEFDGQKATVELNPRGEVVEAAGPRNSDNAAAHWGSRMLEECSGPPEESSVDDDAFATVRDRFGGERWLEIAEGLHRRAAEKRGRA
jgi:hypothetical protein